MTTNSSDTAMTAASFQNTNRRKIRPPYIDEIDNFMLVWLDSNIDLVNDNESKATISRFKKIINKMNSFRDIEECSHFLKHTKEHQIFMITSGSLGQIIVPVVHELPQLKKIYIFCGNQPHHEQWAKHWPKIKCVVTDILPICKALKQILFEYNQKFMSISFIKKTEQKNTKQILKQLNTSFIYTEVLKEMIKINNLKWQDFNDFIIYCRNIFADNSEELETIDKLAHEYQQYSPIWWYTHTNFLYSIINRSLQMMDVDVIMNMEFFIRDLHKNISTLYEEQYSKRTHSKPFTVYHGQTLSQNAWEQLVQTKGGLLSFNNFLSASFDSELSQNFIQQTITTLDSVCVLFVMKIDPSVVSTPFANMREVDYVQEEEILFSIHAVFRIDKIHKMNDTDLWQVDLTLVNDNDPELHALTEHIRRETYADEKGWHRLGLLLIKMEDFDKAQNLYDTLLDQTIEDHMKANIFEQLGLIKENKSEYTDAISYYKQSNEILKNIFPLTNVKLVNSYSNIGFVYDKIGDYSSALSYHLKALEIDQQMLPSNHPDLASSYNNVGYVYDNMGDYSNALVYLDKARDIYEKMVPSDHLGLAASYNNIGWVYRNMGDYTKALSFYERALAIQERSLPVDHPNFQDVRKSIDILKKKI